MAVDFSHLIAAGSMKVLLGETQMNVTHNDIQVPMTAKGGGQQVAAGGGPAVGTTGSGGGGPGFTQPAFQDGAHAQSFGMKTEAT